MFCPMPGTASFPGRNYYAICSYGRSLTDRGEPHLTLEASTSNSPIKLQILVGREWRNPDGIEEVRKLLASLGVKPTASGLATISAEVSAEQFESLFGIKAGEIEPGASGGRGSTDLPVPGRIEKYVASISVAPPHIYLQN
jgi:hypothetical protein